MPYTGKKKLSDEWRTPQWLFDQLNKEFNFKVDVCASEHNKKCRVHYEDCFSYFVDHWAYDEGVNCFMNPPYSNPFPFVSRAWEESKRCVVVCLLKCDPSTKWWAVFWDYDTNKPKPGCEVRFLSKRIKFDPPINYTGRVSSPAFPSVVIIMDRRNLDKSTP